MPKQTEPSQRDLALEVFKDCTDGLLIVSNKNRVAMANKALRIMHGFSMTETVTQEKTMARLVPDQSARNHVIKLWQQDIAMKNPPVRELPMIRQDGKLRWYRFQISHMSNGYICLRVRDITNDRDTEEALKNSEEMFRNLAEQSPNAIFIYKHLKNQVVYANRHCEVLTGYSRKQVYSAAFNYIDLIAPEYHAQMHKAFQHHMTGQESPMREYELLTKKGVRIAIVLTTRLIHFDGTPAILGIITDVTEIKKAQKEILASSKKLREQKKTLQGKNTALKEILTQIETEKHLIRRQVSINAEKLLLPVLQKLEGKSNSIDNRYFDLLKSNIKELTSKFGAELTHCIAKLSPKEVELCNMIRSGLSSKDIAEMLHISIRTVDTHRNRIRRKLGISARNINLSTHLQNLAE